MRTSKNQMLLGCKHVIRYTDAIIWYINYTQLYILSVYHIIPHYTTIYLHYTSNIPILPYYLGASPQTRVAITRYACSVATPLIFCFRRLCYVIGQRLAQGHALCIFNEDHEHRCQLLENTDSKPGGRAKQFVFVYSTIKCINDYSSSMILF